MCEEQIHQLASVKLLEALTCTIRPLLYSVDKIWIFFLSNAFPEGAFGLFICISFFQLIPTDARTLDIWAIKQENNFLNNQFIHNKELNTHS